MIDPILADRFRVVALGVTTISGGMVGGSSASGQAGVAFDGDAVDLFMFSVLAGRGRGEVGALFVRPGYQ